MIYVVFRKTGLMVAETVNTDMLVLIADLMLKERGNTRNHGTAPITLDQGAGRILQICLAAFLLNVMCLILLRPKFSDSPTLN